MIRATNLNMAFKGVCVETRTTTDITPERDTIKIQELEKKVKNEETKPECGYADNSSNNIYRGNQERHVKVKYPGTEKSPETEVYIDWKNGNDYSLVLTERSELKGADKESKTATKINKVYTIVSSKSEMVKNAVMDLMNTMFTKAEKKLDLPQ